jgi:hypothetical protein
VSNIRRAGKDFFASDRPGGFFLGFAGLWREIHRIQVQEDRHAAHETVVRAADDDDDDDDVRAA